LFENQLHIKTEPISFPDLLNHGVTLSMKREDTIHPLVSGNKFRKLKYNLFQAKKLDYQCLLTFGGAFSNHISAVAAAGKEYGFKTIGVIRGDELSDKISENPTLAYAQSCGMQMKFVSREEYKNKLDKDFIERLQETYGRFYLLPEGGTNTLAVKGCEEILTEADEMYDYICASVGTGGTLAGIINASYTHQDIIGFSALKGAFQTSEISKYTKKENYKIIDDYCFGGYAKIDLQLVRFINEFHQSTGIPLDPVYTGKMIFGIIELIKNGYFKENSRILAVHTGGLQGIAGMNKKLKKKNLPQINL